MKNEWTGVDLFKCLVDLINVYSFLDAAMQINKHWSEEDGVE